jgi:N-acetyl-alpha-D-muramate 1-phosphate uridylyltransferase
MSAVSKNMVPKTAMVMAAGLGRRMMPLTADRPKPLVALAGQPLIDHSLEHLAKAGVAHVIVNVHYLADMVEAHLQTNHFGMSVTISDERALLLETGGGLMKVRDQIACDPFLCVNSDNPWTEKGEGAIHRLAAAWDDAAMDFLLLVVPRESAHCHSGSGDFHLSKEGRLERRGADDVTAPFVFTGVQMISKRALVDAPEGPFSTNLFWDRAIAAGRCFGLEHQGEWFDVGTPAAIPVAEAYLNHG